MKMTRTAVGLVCLLGLVLLASCVVSLVLVKATWAKAELSVLSCSAQADSFGLALLAKFFVEDGLIEPPGPDGFFSYESMGLVRNFLYKEDGTAALVQRIRRTCRKKGQPWLNAVQASLGLTYADRAKAWDSYQRTPIEYKLKHYQTPADYKLRGFQLPN